MLEVSGSWIKRRIHDGIIEIQRDPHDKRFLFPDKNSNPANETISLSSHEQTNEGINMTDRTIRAPTMTGCCSA